MKNLRLRKAFTLFEVIIVVAIIIIMVTVGVPFTSNIIVERSLYNAAAQVQQDIRLAQQLAITHSTDPSANPSDPTLRKFEIYFYPSDNKYYVEATEDAEFDPASQIIISGRVITSNNLGEPMLYCHSDDNDSGIMLSNATLSKEIKIIISPIGRIYIKWELR
jgi:type II secretory pathway pseudopilin PulG